jgi:dTDP-glucose 4,6-dehydratase
MRLDDGRAVPNFIQQALKREALTIYGDGAQTRSFCYVDDLIEGIYSLLLSKEHFPINIGNPSEISILALAELINRILGNQTALVQKKDMRLGDDPQRRQPDIQIAMSKLNWEPDITLEEGIKLTYPYFKEKMGLR